MERLSELAVYEGTSAPAGCVAVGAAAAGAADVAFGLAAAGDEGTGGGCA